LLEETAFLNLVEAIFPANIGSCAMARTCDLEGWSQPVDATLYLTERWSVL
jgi:hypothetical protein